MFLTHSDEAFEIEKFKRARKNKIEFAYDYGNLNAKKIIIDLEDEVVSLLEKEKANLETIKSLKSKGFESSENVISESDNQSENDRQVVEKEGDNMESSKEIAPEMFKLNVSQSVSSISIVRRPKHSGVIWKKKGSSNTSNVDLSSVSHSKLNKDVKRYSRKDLFSCNNSHIRETSSAYVCNDAMNVSCNSRLYDSFDENNLLIFNDESVRNSPISKMHFRKKPRDYLNVRSKSHSNKSLPRTMHRWLPKMQPLAEPVAKWIPRIVQIYLWIIDSGCSKHMTDGVDLLTGDRSSNLYTIALNEVALNSSTCLLAKASSSQSWLWHQRDIEVSVGYSKESASFRIYKKRTRKIHESMNKVEVPSSNNQSVSNNMVPNVNQASTSHNVFSEHLKDAYFDASTSFHDPSNVHTFYQPYPHEKKWTKDHPLHKIIRDLKSSVRTRGQLANSCLFSCLLSSIEPANLAEALRDADWVSAKQDKLDQFARLKIWRLVPRPEGKTIIKTKWIFKNKKDESEEVYVGQPPGFVSKQYPDHAYALNKALYGLKQAPRAWYDILSQFLIDSGFQKGSIDTTLFIKKKGKHIILGMENCDTISTSMVEQAKLKLDLVGKPVDHTDYRSMIGSLMYVTSSRPDIMFATCMCARYHANPIEHHVSAVKRIFRYFKGTTNLGLWYPEDSGFGDKLVCWSSKKQNCVSISTAESEYVAVSSCCAQVL
nr:hypothetical protein [Tanacetum cinerariifolium]